MFHNLNMILLCPNKKISVFWVTSLKNLGRVGRHSYFFSGKKYDYKIIYIFQKN